MRFLPNPHYEPDAAAAHRPRRSAWSTYIGRDGRLAEFYERLMPLLDFLLPQYVSEGKAHLTIAIGCTGGRHRSVAIAEHLGARYSERDDVLVEVVHRDADRASGYGDADPSGTTTEFATLLRLDPRRPRRLRPRDGARQTTAHAAATVRRGRRRARGSDDATNDDASERQRPPPTRPEPTGPPGRTPRQCSTTSPSRSTTSPARRASTTR